MTPNGLAHLSAPPPLPGLVHVPDPQPRAPPPHALFSVSLQAAAPASLLSVHLLPLTSPLAPLLESHLFPPAPGGDAFDLFAKPPEPAEPPEQEPSQPPSSAKSNSPVGKSRGSGQGPIWAGGDRDLSLPIAERQLQGWPGCAWLLMAWPKHVPTCNHACRGLGLPCSRGGSSRPCVSPISQPRRLPRRLRGGARARHTAASAPPRRAVTWGETCH